METEIFKRNVISADSRNVGEKFVQPILDKFYGYEPSKDSSYDSLDGNKKLEYKSGRASFPKEKKKISLYESFMNPEELYNRRGKISDIVNGKITVNFQNIKPHTFDLLIYVIISDDGFDIYKITKEELEEKVKMEDFPNWSEHHGREEKGGRNCQFHITSKNIEWHNRYKIDHLSWEDIAKLAKEIY